MVKVKTKKVNFMVKVSVEMFILLCVQKIRLDTIVQNLFDLCSNIKTFFSANPFNILLRNYYLMQKSKTNL